MLKHFSLLAVLLLPLAASAQAKPTVPVPGVFSPVPETVKIGAIRGYDFIWEARLSVPTGADGYYFANWLLRDAHGWRVSVSVTEVSGPQLDLEPVDPIDASTEDYTCWRDWAPCARQWTQPELGWNAAGMHTYSFWLSKSGVYVAWVDGIEFQRGAISWPVTTKHVIALPLPANATVEWNRRFTTCATATSPSRCGTR